MTRGRQPTYAIAAADTETDPFEQGLVPQPFSWGCYTSEDYTDDWNDDPKALIGNFFDHIGAIDEPTVFYFHNGGKFDFYMGMVPYFAGNPVRIINGRIVEAVYKQHILRDSYAAVPVALAKFGDKLDIDYRKLHRDVRHQHRAEILKYQKVDCQSLYDVMVRYREMFGDKVTMASAAMAEFKKVHEVKYGAEDFDAKFRPFYFGGRNQCFEAGVIKTKGRIYDINSQYPYAMRTFKHPTTTRHFTRDRIGPQTVFAEITAINRGAIPIRGKLSLDFTVPKGRFFATKHEIEAGEDTGSLEVLEVHNAYDFPDQENFSEFVDKFYTLRLEAKAAKDILRTEFYKLVMNSAYGKFAMDPSSYNDWILLEAFDAPPEEAVKRDGKLINKWSLAHHIYGYSLWKGELENYNYLNVATAASITGAARSVLLRGIAKATRPIYCDTDSLICEALDGVEINQDTLGAWKDEGGFDEVAVAGKKLYAAFNRDHVPSREKLDKMACKCGTCQTSVKLASKGSKLSPCEVRRVAEGDVLRWLSDKPTFKLDGTSPFLARNIRRTAKNLVTEGA